MGKRTQNIFVLTGALIFVFLAGELAIAFLDVLKEKNADASSLEERGVYRGSRYDPLVNHAHIPGLKFIYTAQDKKEFKNLVEYSSKGLHDYEHDYEKPEGTIRILVFGDSFVEGIQVKIEENFCKLMEGALNRGGSSPKAEVINMGVSGYSPILEYLYLKKEGLKYEPDIVIACFFMNDVYEDMAYKGMALFDSEGLPLKVDWRGFDKAEKLEGWKRFERKFFNSVKGFLNKSRFYVFLKERFYVLLRKLKLRKVESAENQFFILTDDTSEKIEEAWNDTLRYISAMKRLADERGAKFLLVIIPLELQLADNPKDAAFFTYFDKRPDSEKANAHLSRFCIRHNIDCINLLPEFRNGGAKGLYFRNDGHFTRKGHRETADILLKKVEELGWIRYQR